MGLSEIDRNLLRRCLERRPGAWEDFVDRFLGLVVHVIHHTARSRSIKLSAADAEDLASDVFFALIDNDFAVLRHFRGESSLATYLTVVARRVVVRQLLHQPRPVSLTDVAEQSRADASTEFLEQRIDDRDEVERLLQRLNGDEAKVVRMYHLEGKSYGEISTAVGMPENSVGPMLSRAREKIRRTRAVE